QVIRRYGPDGLARAHNPKVAGSNPAPATKTAGLSLRVGWPKSGWGRIAACGAEPPGQACEGPRAGQRIAPACRSCQTFVKPPSTTAPLVPAGDRGAESDDRGGPGLTVSDLHVTSGSGGVVHDADGVEGAR